MSLPKGRMSTHKVTLSGGEVEVRSLTIAQSRIAGKLDSDESMVAAISFATGTPKEEVVEWVADAPAGDVADLLNAIADVSGLTQGAQFRK